MFKVWHVEMGCTPPGMGIQAEEAERVLESVGFNAEMRQKAIASLSGGWKMKLALGTVPATSTVCEPSLLP